MVAQVKPTKKNSPAVKVGSNKNTLPAEKYAMPHDMSGNPVGNQNVELTQDPNALAANKMTRLTGAPRVSMGDPANNPTKTTGVKQRGFGAATKGYTSRGPLA